MKRAYWVMMAIGIIVSMIAAGCASATPAAPAATQPPAATTQPAGTVSASAKAEPVQTSNMAFVIGAPVKEVDVKAGDQVKAGQKLVVLDTPELDYAVVSAQAELKSAQANAALQHMANKDWNAAKGKFVYTSGPPELRQLADARVVKAQAALDGALANQAQGTLVAPYDGTVVSINVVPGEMAVPQQTMLVLADLSHLQIATTDLSEREIANVQVGQTATTRLKAFEQDLTGKVVGIEPKATQSNGDTVFKVTIELDHPPMGLMWGMTGDVNILVR